MSSSEDDREKLGHGDESNDEEHDVKIGVAKASANEDDENSNDGHEAYNNSAADSSNIPKAPILNDDDDRKPAAIPRHSNKEYPDEKASYCKWASEMIDQTSAARSIIRRKSSQDGDIDVEKAESAAVDESDVKSSPPAAQKAYVNEKGVLASTTRVSGGGGARRLGRQKALLPGAEFVPGRAPGMRPSWYVQQLRRESMGRRGLLIVEPPQRVQEDPPQRTQEEEHPATAAESSAACTLMVTPALEESAPAPSLKGQRKAFYCYAAIVVCLIVGTAVGVSVGLTTRNDSPGTDNTTRFSPFTDDCNALQSQPQPNVLSQCQCKGTISAVASDIAARYQVLKETFLPTLYPDVHESLESCSSQNQALLWLASGDGVSTGPTIRQRYLLALLYVSWNGPSWDAAIGWMSAQDECSWIGVSCNANSEVVKIDLSDRNLSGDIGSEFALMTSITSLSLGRNTLHGTLPTEIGNLPNFREFSVPFNALSGSIPSECGTLPALTSLVLDSNRLGAALPSELGLLTPLQILHLSNNHMNGTIPTEFGLLSGLQFITLTNNTLTGGLPTEIGLWNRLQSLDFSFNNFFGSTIPSEIGMMTALTTFAMVKTGLNGTLPVELFEIKDIEVFSASFNNLHGTISTLIGELTSLGTMDLVSNYISGTLPSEIATCSSLSQLSLYGNKLHGTIPSELGGLVSHPTLELTGNHFSGTVSSEVCNAATLLFCLNGDQTTFQCTCCSCPSGAYG